MGPKALSRDETAMLVRLINTKIIGRSDLSALTYEGFLQFFVQLAYYLFSRPPRDMSHLPPVETVKELLHHFEVATRNRGESTVLFDDPDKAFAGD